MVFEERAFGNVKNLDIFADQNFDSNQRTGEILVNVFGCV